MNHRKLSDIHSILLNHWDWEVKGQKPTIDNWLSLYKSFPEFHYSGPAFRALLAKELKKLPISGDSQYFRSFSKSMEGVGEYLNGRHIDCEIETDDRVIIVRAEIVGVDVQKISAALIDAGFSGHEAEGFRREEEVIAVEIGEWDHHEMTPDEIWQGNSKKG